MRLFLLLCCLLLDSLLLGHARPVNINTAPAAEIREALQGIGPNRAQRIVDYRSKHGAFKSPEDIMSVPYIGRRLFEINREDILTHTP